ncbi:MAG: PEP-CTERM sorting domain-containing protein [Phycisphaeraceae bacterium]
MNSFRITAAMMVAIATWVLVAGQAQAAVQTTTATANSFGFTVSSTDLLNQGQQLASSSFVGTDTWGGGPVSKLTDGAMYGVNQGDTTGSLSPQEGDVATFFLDTTTNTAGYDITSLVTYTAYEAGVFVAQGYDVAYRQVNSALFTPLTTVSVADNQGQEVRVTIDDSGAGFIATGVDALQFTYHGNFFIYREYDLFGSASVIPEPASLGLLAIGVGTMVLGRRRRA